MDSNCYNCHSEDEEKGGLRLDNLEFAPNDARNSRVWEEIYDRVSMHEMPPKKKRRRPPLASRAEFCDTLSSLLVGAEERSRATDGRVVLRRLNREEYQNTVRDLFGVEVDLLESLPEDTSAGGFDNIGEALSMSAVLLESYLNAADKALDAAFTTGPRPPLQQWDATLIPQNVRPPRENGAIDGRLRSGVRFLSNGTAVFFNSLNRLNRVENFTAPTAGFYRFKIKAYAYQSPGQPLSVGWYGGSFRADSLNTHLIGHYDVYPDRSTLIEFVDKLPSGGTVKPVPSRLGYRYMENTDGYQGPGIAVESVEVEGPLIDSWPARGYQLMLGDQSDGTGTLEDADRALRALAPRAFRRPVSDADIAPYRALVEVALNEGKDFLDALRVGLKGMLCSSDFLFLRESPGELDGHALASRLSYFLWSSLPDETLTALADTGELRQPAVLRAQVERMLDDPKSRRFVVNFTGQWLGVRNIRETTPSKKLYPEFDPELEDAMVNETHRFFEELLKFDLSVTNIVHSDFALLNGRLAELYGIPGVTGQQFRRVTLPPDAHRGGVMCQAAVLKVTANGTTTSPIIRGNWILTNILGRPVKPPPPTVPALEPDIRGAVTIREQVVKHREQQSCAVCHDRMDPLGLALENYDVIGQWRTSYRVPVPSEDDEPSIDNFKGGPHQIRASFKLGQAVRADSILPDGREFENLDELKQLLLADREQILRSAMQKLLIYATGGTLSFTDKIGVKHIVRNMPPGQDGLRTLIHSIVQSPTFRQK